MSEQGTTKDQVSLEDLKRAIAVLTDTKWPVVAGIDGFYEKARADAWCTAYEWREGVLRRFQEQFFPGQAETYIAELNEGMALIREKLR